MGANKFRCHNCGRLVSIKVIGQAYCGEAACQKARKNAWRREKYASDPDYQLNQRDSTKAWLNSVGGSAAYYREYRKRKKTPKERTRKVSRLKEPFGESLFTSIESGSGASANSDAGMAKFQIKTGRYRIYPESANSDAIWAEIRVISNG